MYLQYLLNNITYIIIITIYNTFICTIIFDEKQVNKY